jgi:activator of HSP90 ATPase
MAKTITQKIVFKNTTAKVLYDMYMNEKKHSELTGGSAKITSKIGASYSVYDGYITGKNLHLVKDQMIVQTWRGSDWKKTDKDSILVLNFHQKGEDAVVKMAHVNIPTNQVDGIKKGWDDYYWEPWKKYLADKK